jgi:hypothetical protein
MAAMMTWADPSTAWATGLDGLLSARALDEPQVCIRQGAYQSAGGFEGNHGVFGVG